MVRSLNLSTSKHLVRVFYRCSVWFDSSELLQTILLEMQTLCEGVLQEFGVVRFFRTSSNYTTGLANTWLGCLYRCSVWFDSSEPHRTTPLDTREFGVVQSLFRISSNLIEPHQTLARYNTCCTIV